MKRTVELIKTNGNQKLWAVIDEYGHTACQIWSDKKPNV